MEADPPPDLRCMLGSQPSAVNWMTDRCKKITLPKLCLWAVIKRVRFCVHAFLSVCTHFLVSEVNQYLVSNTPIQICYSKLVQSISIKYQIQSTNVNAKCYLGTCPRPSPNYIWWWPLKLEAGTVSNRTVRILLQCFLVKHKTAVC